MNKQKLTMHEDDQEEGLLIPQGQKYLPFMLKEDTVTYQTISFVLDDSIKQPAYYTPLLETIYRAGEDDTVVLRIDSPGGSVDGAIAIIDALENTAADVHCYVSGLCASAATLIALSCPNIAVSSRSRWMVHAASWASAGKSAEILSHSLFLEDQIKTLMQECYTGFLTAKELEEVLIGRDLYFRSAEVQDRIEKRMQHLQKQQKAKQKQEKLLAKSASKPKQDLFPTS